MNQTKKELCMKNMTKIGLLNLLCITSSMYSSSEQYSKFKPYSTDDFNYDYKITQEDSASNDISIPSNEPVMISDTTTNNQWNTGVIRIKISKLTHPHKIMTTTETWVTRDPSYKTTTNICLVLVGLVVLGKLSEIY